MQTETSAQKRRVLVLGGSGFIGRHAVAALLAAGCEVVIGSRHPDQIESRAPGLAGRCGLRRAPFEFLTDLRDWAPVLAGVDVVINCVGILRQREGETYRCVHHLAPAALAEACKRRGLRLIHVSALGLHCDARSRFLRSKLAGEHALRASGADWLLVRPSLLDGDGGYGAKWLRMIARWPVHALPADAIGRIAALHVADLGEALARLATMHLDADAPEAARIVELGGSEYYTLAEYVAALRKRVTDRPALRIRIPGVFARALSRLFDLLHLTPFSFGHWELLQQDNAPHINRLPCLLGRAPRAIGEGIVAGPHPAPAPALSRELHHEARVG
jgi:NADH dehydrogenase